jgi:hypothetical protein
METIVGSGRYTYKVHEDWAKAPANIEMKPAAVAVGPHDRIYCFNRSAEHPVVVFDRNGEFLSSWGAGMFRFPHAIRFDAEGNAWLTDGHDDQAGASAAYSLSICWRMGLVLAMRACTVSASGGP